ncbi:MAG: DNA repair protein RadC [Candidatus Eremiobacteraeota bacterium]|nr:DNA repair protein RadC [Candidatus Eremiobacteraeota bacterium]
MYQLNPALASDRSRRDLLPELRPREKLETDGLETLKEWELLSLVLGRGCPGASVEQLSQHLAEMIFAPDGTAEIPTLKACTEIKGLGKAKAAAVVAGLELGRRMQTFRGRPIHSPEDALVHFQWLFNESREHFHVLYLDTRRRLISARTTSIGTLEASLVHPREVFRPAFELSASSILVAHNHPSGDPEPSPEDLALTSRLDRAARLLGIRLVDHLIVAGRDWISLRQRQMNGHSGQELFAA